MIDMDPYDSDHYCIENIQTLAGSIEVKQFTYTFKTFRGVARISFGVKKPNST